MIDDEAHVGVAVDQRGARGYCSGAPAVSREVPGLDIVPLPTELSVNPAYGMVLLNAKPVTLRFAIFLMSEAGQAVLKAHGFDPTAFVEPGAPQRGLLVQRAGAASQLISPERFAALAHITQRFPSGRGEQQDEWTGPLLSAKSRRTLRAGRFNLPIRRTGRRSRTGRCAWSCPATLPGAAGSAMLYDLTSNRSEQIDRIR
jgi:hypothetical protein